MPPSRGSVAERMPTIEYPSCRLKALVTEGFQLNFMNLSTSRETASALILSSTKQKAFKISNPTISRAIISTQ